MVILRLPKKDFGMGYRYFTGHIRLGVASLSFDILDAKVLTLEDAQEVNSTTVFDFEILEI